jgi:hypothetical protein
MSSLPEGSLPPSHKASDFALPAETDKSEDKLLALSLSKGESVVNRNCLYMNRAYNGFRVFATLSPD